MGSIGSMVKSNIVSVLLAILKEIYFRSETRMWQISTNQESRKSKAWTNLPCRLSKRWISNDSLLSNLPQNSRN